MVAVIGYVAAFLTTAAAVPQLVQTWRTRDVEGISTAYWITLSTGVTLWLVYGCIIADGPLIAANAISLALDLTVLALALRYRPRRG